MPGNCIFCKIANGEIPAQKVYEDEDCVVFHDLNPVAPVHLLLVPRKHVVSLQDVGPSDALWLGKMLTLLPRVAADNGCQPGPEGGFRLVVNSGRHGGQEVLHLHFHILGGPRPWPGRAALNAA
jgi:histidine triad (HIT) family protein